MIFLLFYLGFIVSLVSNAAFATGYEINLQCDEQVFQGSSPDCLASVIDGGHLATDTFTFVWYDNAVPAHTTKDDKTNATSLWRIPYKREEMTPGWYNVRVDVCQWVIFSFFCKEIGSVGFTIVVTGQLNGQINITQQNLTREFDFVSTNGTAVHHVALEKADREYVATAPTLLSYWFVDCVYYGHGGENFSFGFNYTKPEESHMIEALVVADFTPLPPTTTVPPSTTTAKPTTTTSKPTSTTTKVTTTTTKKPVNSTLIPAKQKRSIDSVRRQSINVTANDIKQSNSSVANHTSNIKVWVNGTLVPYNGSFPYVCGGSTIVPPDDKKAYGYFKRNVTVKAPISNLTIKGNNWLQKGDMLDLQVKCLGSENMQYCLEFFNGIYNVTGNETCEQYLQLDVCEFPIKRYLLKKNTVLIIIKNDVSKIVTPVTVTIYEVEPQGQLSVIVVPVVFTLIAVVLIVFGVSYYLQNKSRFVVEVADFDFGQQYADMEYKTFRERLRDSVVNAFTKDPMAMASTSDVSVWPPGHKYGSMT